MDRETFNETLVDWMEHARMGLHLSSATHVTDCDAYTRFVKGGRAVLPHMKSVFFSSPLTYYWLFDESHWGALSSIKAFGFPSLIQEIDPEFSMPEQLWGNVNGLMMYTQGWLERYE